jgi:S1-C subfamily serine protease
MSEYEPGRDPEQQAGQPGQSGQPGQHGQYPGQPSPPAPYGQYGQYGQPGGWNPYSSPQPPHQPTQYLPPYSSQYGNYAPPRRSGLRSTGLVLGAIALAALIGLGIGRYAWQPSSGASSPLDGPTIGNGSAGPGSSAPASSSLNVQAIAAKVDPGLVDVTSVLGYQNQEAAGTGIVLTSNGDVLTNNHVVEGATSFQVTDIGNGRTYRATVVGYDRSHDVAVLHMTGATGLATASIGNSSKVAIGDSVIGIGNAGGTGGAPSTAPGTVTALNQSITASDQSSSSSEQLAGLIQVAADIRSGDSGGALVNGAGQVIGMDTAATVGYQFQGQSAAAPNSSNAGFAIPINQAVSIAHQIETGKASATVHTGDTAFLGVSVASAGSQGGTGGTGAVVERIVPNSPAQQAGITAGDTILSVNGQQIGAAQTLTTLMDQHHPGDQLTVIWLDQAGQQHTGTVVPATGPVG